MRQASLNTLLKPSSHWTLLANTHIGEENTLSCQKMSLPDYKPTLIMFHNCFRSFRNNIIDGLHFVSIQVYTEFDLIWVSYDIV